MQEGGMAMPEQHEATPKRARVLIVDDHPIVRQGLAQMLGQEADLTVCGEAEEAQRALEAVATLRPDLVLVDISLKGSNGLDLIKSLRAYDSSLPILVVSMHDELLYAERVLRAGAQGYIMKQEATNTMMGAIRRVLQGEIYVSEKMTTTILRKVSRFPDPSGSPIERLSDRELEVFQLIGQGHGTRQIAQMLHLSVKTVESHRARILDKLQLQNAAELMRHAMRWTHTALPD
jgi:DNA-binding NarL/FixJ family response regulator